MKKEEIKNLLDKFEAAANVVEEVECWSARELQTLLGYAKWDNFINNVVVKAKEACRNAGEDITKPFSRRRKMVSIGYGVEKQIDDILLTRYACYLIAQNGDSRKPQVAFAQTYFAVQTRKAEIIEQRLLDYERVKAREKLSRTEKQLSGILYERDIDSKGFAIIRSKGDQALFNMNTQVLKKKMGVPSGRPVADFLPTISIKAKDLAAEMTNINVQSKDLYGQPPIEKEHVDNNSAVRDMLLKRGIHPEQLSPGEDVKKVQKRIENEDKKVLKRNNSTN
ncbi:DNA damage-inducible protein D [Parabacteroides sp. AF48-14]|uniref:DNA damage-inducible protein D n=1 Tax=Parabacteroides sp. AF48-14 TaxID=2292052 RepID=UPI000EFF2C72|nr:DNA damage-inducible protein D [Parabacteroides sp. AF48-14]RHO67860.1 DNA damage-inducible protein D [Parabacteroides sp. AF48-14]